MAFLNKKSPKSKAGGTPGAPGTPGTPGIRTVPTVPVEVPAVPAPKPAAGPRSVSGVEKKPSRGAPLRPIEVTYEAIAMAAYFRWQRFGGDDATNWRLAEQELREDAARLQSEG